jgi:hypothetical protein
VGRYVKRKTRLRPKISPISAAVRGRSFTVVAHKCQNLIYQALALLDVGVHQTQGLCCLIILTLDLRQPPRPQSQGSSVTRCKELIGEASESGEDPRAALQLELMCKK